MPVKKLACLFLTAVLCIFGAALQAASATLEGTVESAGKPVTGVKITAKDSAGKTVGQAVTDEKGQYTINLDVGKYVLTAYPGPNGLDGTGVIFAEECKTVNWMISTTADAIATAKTCNPGPAFFPSGPEGTVGKIITGSAVFTGVTNLILWGAGVYDGDTSPY